VKAAERFSSRFCNKLLLCSLCLTCVRVVESVFSRCFHTRRWL
jgi:hypothetical protein